MYHVFTKAAEPVQLNKVRNFKAFTTRLGVSSRPSRSGSSPKPISNVRTACLMSASETDGWVI
jgi:hypothetical protein